MSEETKIPRYTARKLAAAVSRIIELDVIELTQKMLSEEEFDERVELRTFADEAESSQNLFVQGILAPLKCWDGES